MYLIRKILQWLEALAWPSVERSPRGEGGCDVNCASCEASASEQHSPGCLLPIHLFLNLVSESTGFGQKEGEGEL